MGSGFFISSDGFLVTNYHVISKAQALVVKMADGKTIPAQIVGISQRTDLAVLKISHRGKGSYRGGLFRRRGNYAKERGSFHSRKPKIH